MEWYQLYLGGTRNLTLLQHQYDITKLYGRWINLEESKGLMGNFIWCSKIPENIRLDEGVLKISLVFVFKRRLNQVEYIRLSHSSSEDVFKTFQSRPLYSSRPYVFKTSWTRFQDVFKTSSRRLAKMPSRRRWRIIRLNYLPRSHFWEIYG